MKSKKVPVMLLVTGGVIGVLAVLLTIFGNPKNMGICVACFIRDTAGALGLHQAVNVQYIRPEVIGFILGAFILAVAGKEFKPSGGSSPLLRFTISFFVMVGALVFLGCPLRMVLRLAGGDANAIIGLLGFIAGIGAGAFLLKKGFSLGRAQIQPKSSGFIMPIIAILLLIFLLARPAFILFSQEGPGSMQAPIWMALGAGLLIGGLAQRSRMCMAGGIRDLFLIKDASMLTGYIAVFVAALVANIATGNFHFGFAEQPVAHTSFLWNFLGMALVGYGCTLIGGCPLRQCIMAGEGNADAAICVVGMAVGAAFCHNFGLAASPAGVPVNGQVAVALGFVILTGIAVLNIYAKKGLVKAV